MLMLSKTLVLIQRVRNNSVSYILFLANYTPKPLQTFINRFLVNFKEAIL